MRTTDILERVDKNYDGESVGQMLADVMHLLVQNKRLRDALEPFVKAYDYENNHSAGPLYPGNLVVWIAEDETGDQHDISFEHLSNAKAMSIEP